MQQRPIPPFTRDTALKKIEAAEDSCNTRDPQKVTLAYSPDCVLHDREESFQGRAAISFFLRRKWALEQHYRLTRALSDFSDNRISVRFEHEWQRAGTDQWYRTHGEEHWEFDADGFMTRRDICANSTPITVSERRVGR